MISFVNPAASLTAGRVPVAAGGGVLGDGSILDDGASVRVVGAPVRFSRAALYSSGAAPSLLVDNADTLANRTTVRIRTENDKAAELLFDVNGAARWDFSARSSGDGYGLGLFKAGSTPSLTAVGVHSFFHQSGAISIGSLSEVGAGKLQFVDHSTEAGGIRFGTNLPVYSSSPTTLRVGGTVDATAMSAGIFTAGAGYASIGPLGLSVDGLAVVASSRAGWNDPATWTGAADRSTLNLDTATAKQVGQRLLALIEDLYSGHRLIKT